ncbi:hypothetical protein Vretimale_2334 [Volvox reticuliferus]|nr:hypothetical protein Vretimale_2334 [Volvox reticuliferus]
MANKRIDNFGHVGGLLGGALLAYLLGPRFVAVVGEGGARGLQDLPPIRWLAFKGPGAGGSGTALSLRRRSLDGAAATGSPRHRSGPDVASPQPLNLPCEGEGGAATSGAAGSG